MDKTNKECNSMMMMNNTILTNRNNNYRIKNLNQRLKK